MLSTPNLIKSNRRNGVDLICLFMGWVWYGVVSQCSTAIRGRTGLDWTSRHLGDRVSKLGLGLDFSSGCLVAVVSLGIYSGEGIELGGRRESDG